MQLPVHHIFLPKCLLYSGFARLHHKKQLECHHSDLFLLGRRKLENAGRWDLTTNLHHKKMEFKRNAICVFPIPGIERNSKITHYMFEVWALTFHFFLLVEFEVARALPFLLIFGQTKKNQGCDRNL